MIISKCWIIDFAHAGAIELSKHPSSTRRVINPPKFFAVQVNVVIRPHKVTRSIGQFPYLFQQCLGSWYHLVPNISLLVAAA